jgi:hypothetical protein
MLNDSAPLVDALASLARAHLPERVE